MERAGLSAMYERLTLAQAFEVFLASVARGDTTAARHVVDAMPSESCAVRRSHLLQLADGFKLVAQVLERELAVSLGLT